MTVSVLSKRTQCLQATRSIVACYLKIAAIDFMPLSFVLCANTSHLYRNLSDVSYRLWMRSHAFFLKIHSFWHRFFSLFLFFNVTKSCSHTHIKIKSSKRDHQPSTIEIIHELIKRLNVWVCCGDGRYGGPKFSFFSVLMFSNASLKTNHREKKKKETISVNLVMRCVCMCVWQKWNV